MEKKTIRRLDKLPGWLSLHEGQFLRKSALMVRDNPGTIVEIGSFQGKSTIWLASTRQTVYAVDPHMGEVDDKKLPPTLSAFKKHIKEFGVAEWVNLLRMTSMEAAAGWDKKIKLLFIDGLHDEANAGQDYRSWSPFVTEGGIVAMHDAFCGWEGVEKVAEKYIVDNDDYREVGVVGSIIYGIKGKGDTVSRILRQRSRLGIKAALRLHRLAAPSALSFFLVHRVLKLFLLNRYTFKRDMC